MRVLDFRGVELNPGDEVSYVEPYYRDLKLGTVMYLTPKGARIMPCNNNCEINRMSNHIVKMESEDE